MKLYGKNQPIERLAEFSRSGRLPHALMFYGDKGVGKSTLAMYAAMMYLCSEGGEQPCFSCAQCHRIEKYSHPDVVFVKKILTDEKYNAKELRQIITDSYILPNDGDLRVYVFQDLEEMNNACQNSLLKFIEEPLPCNRCIFTANTLSGIRDTIISRTALVPVLAAEIDECVASLLDRGIENNEARRLAAAYSGNIGNALNAFNNEEQTKLEATIQAIVTGIIQRNEYKTAIAFAQLKNREQIQKALESLFLTFTAALVSKTNGMGSDSEKALARSASIRRLYQLCEAIEKFIAQMEFNPNVALATAYFTSEIFDEN